MTDSVYHESFDDTPPVRSGETLSPGDPTDSPVNARDKHYETVGCQSVPDFVEPVGEIPVNRDNRPYQTGVRMAVPPTERWVYVQ